MDNQIKANPDKCHFISSTNDAVKGLLENTELCWMDNLIEQS